MFVGAADTLKSQFAPRYISGEGLCPPLPIRGRSVPDPAGDITAASTTLLVGSSNTSMDRSYQPSSFLAGHQATSGCDPSGADARGLSPLTRTVQLRPSLAERHGSRSPCSNQQVRFSIHEKGRTAMAVADMEELKTEVQKVLRSVGTHGRLIGAAVVAAETSAGTNANRMSRMDQLSRSVNALCEDLQEWLQHVTELQTSDPAAAVEDPSYQDLRQSLSLSQRRCNTLNDDMLRMAEANEELVSTMYAVKAANRQLVDKIQARSEEIAKLTQARLEAERKSADLMQEQWDEADKLRREADKELLRQQEENEEDLKNRRSQLHAELRSKRQKLQALLEQLREAKKVQQSLAQEAKTNLDSLQHEVLGRLQGRLIEHLTREQSASRQRLQKLEDESHVLRTRLHCEREAHQREVAVWQSSESELVGENTELAAQGTAEAQQLQASIDGAEKARADLEARIEDDEREQSRDNRSPRELAQESVVKVAQLEAAVHGTRCTVALLDAQQARGVAEGDRLDKEAMALDRMIQESETALDSTVAGNEALLRQKDQQRSEAQNSGERMLRAMMEEFDAEFAQVTKQQQEEADALAQKLQELELAHATQVAETQAAAHQVEVLLAKRTSLHRDCAFWKGQEEIASRQRNEVENELHQGNKEKHQHIEVLRRQQEELASRKASLLGVLEATKANLDAFRRSVATRCSEGRSHIASLEASLAETSQELSVVQRDLQEKQLNFESLRREEATRRTAAAEAQQNLESSLQRTRLHAESRKEELLRKIAEERLRAETCEAESVHYRRQADEEMVDVKAEPSSMIAALEKAVNELQQRHKAEVSRTTSRLEASQERAKALETEIRKQQELLDETELRLQSDTEMTRKAKAETATALGRLESEKVAASEKLEQCQQTERRLAAELEALRSSGSAEQARLNKELADLNRNIEKQAREAQIKMDNLRTRRERELVLSESRMRSEIDRQDQKWEAARAENVRWRNLTGQQEPHRSSGVTFAPDVAHES
mmetsp:Transcript_17695/g.41103  ORF Transcript_17695/g.41103 Transcript_17695/m.41103 type:complete len:1010 (+) Transcript_17695:69-3098(+)